jgi:hypothetical protein
MTGIFYNASPISKSIAVASGEEKSMLVVEFPPP